MGWWIALGILFLLGILPLGVSAVYNADGPVVRVVAGPVRIQVWPWRWSRKEKQEETPEEKPEEPKKTSKKKKSSGKKKPKSEPKPQPQEETAEEEKGGDLLELLPLLGPCFQFLGDLRRKLRVNRLDVKLVLTGDDPCDLASCYGKTWAAVGNLLPRLERFLVIKKKNIDISCDFEAQRSTVDARVDLTITLGRLLWIALVFAVRALTVFLKITNKRKGGTDHEPKSS